MRGISLSAVIVLVSVLAGALSAAAQDLGEVARQERERKNNLTTHAPVLTNEDLARDQILPPKPDATVEAVTPSATSEQKPAQKFDMWSAPAQPNFSLGEYARKLHQEKAERLANQRETKPLAPPPVEVRADSRPSEVHVARKPAAVHAASREPEFHESPARVLHAESRPVEVHPQSRPAESVRREVVTNDAGDRRRVEVRRGDSLWKIARRHLGYGHLWALVWKSNPAISKPELIRVGQNLQLPSAEIVTAALAKEGATRMAAIASPHRKEMAAQQFSPIAPVLQVTAPPTTRAAGTARVGTTLDRTQAPAEPRVETQAGSLGGFPVGRFDRREAADPASSMLRSSLRSKQRR